MTNNNNNTNITNTIRVKQFDVADTISNYFKTIITQIEEYIENNIDNVNELLITMQTISDNINSILSKHLDHATKEDYERKIKSLEMEIQHLKEKDLETHTKLQNQNLAMQTSTLPSVHIDAGTSNYYNNHNHVNNNNNDNIQNDKDSYCSDYLNEQLIHKLRSKMKQNKDHYKYQEFLYITRINELTNTIRTLEKKLEIDEKERMINTLTSFPVSAHNSFNKLNKFDSNNIINYNKLFRNASTGRYVVVETPSKMNTNNNTIINSVDNAINNNNNEVTNVDDVIVGNNNNSNTINATDKDIIKTKELQLYGLYQKNRMKQIYKRNFKLESNLQSINNIIGNYNHKLVPQYKYLKPEKKYYSAFVKKFT